MVIHILHSRSRATRGCSDQQSFLVSLEVIALSAGQINSLPDYSSRVGAEAVVIQDQSIILAFHLREKELFCSSLRELCSCDSMDGEVQARRLRTQLKKFVPRLKCLPPQARQTLRTRFEERIADISALSSSPPSTGIAMPVRLGHHFGLDSCNASIHAAPGAAESKPR